MAPAKKQAAQNASPRAMWRRVIIGGSLLVAVGIILGGYALAYARKVYPGVKIAGLNVGGKSIEQARALVSSAVDGLPDHLTLVFGEQEHAIERAVFNPQYDALRSAEQAYQVGRAANFFVSLKEQFQSALFQTKIPIAVTYDEAALKNELQSYLATIETPEVDASFKWQTDNFTTFAGAPGKRADQQILLQALVSRIKQLNWQAPVTIALYDVPPAFAESDLSATLETAQKVIETNLALVARDRRFNPSKETIATWLVVERDAQKQPQLSIDLNQVESYLDTLGTQVDQLPQDARLTVSNGELNVLERSTNGSVLDRGSGAKKIKIALLSMQNGTIVLPLKTALPQVNSDSPEQLARLGLKELVGSATTDFSGSPRNRQYNIKNGARFLNGILVRPGDIFSTLNYLGTIDGSTGYLPELVIKENKTTPEFGGGLCQVSTTLFRAILSAGLPIVERQNHSYRVGYYERGVGPGLDATIYSPKPDLKFKNDTPGWILVQSRVEGARITFEFYGTADGRRAEVGQPYLYDVSGPPDPEYVETDTLAKGEKKKIESAHAGGKTTASYKVFNAGGSVRFETVFRSYYKPWQERWLVGTNEALGIVEEGQ